MEPIIGEIGLFAFNFAPTNWLPCDGRLLEIGRYSALFSLLGNRYGGDGRATFALPNLNERALIGVGAAVGLTPRALGDAPGSGWVTLREEEIPLHVHQVQGTLLVTQNPGDTDSPAGNYLAGTLQDQYGEETQGRTMAADLVSGTAQPVGGSARHLNTMPSLVLTYAICVAGVYPE